MVDLKHKKIFNQESREDFMEARIVGGNPNGIINFNRTPHKFFTGLYKSMRARTWFPQQVNISKDKINYSKLTPEEKRSYDLVLAQLIANDSIQTNQIMDSFNRYITSPVVNACLAQQAADEVVHSDSYAVMAEDICQDTDRIYKMHEVDEELQIKNEAVAKMYDIIYNNHSILVLTDYDGNVTQRIESEPVTPETIAIAAVANQILEGMVFQTGFAVMYSLENKMVGTAEMIKEIHKDEL